MSSIQRLISGIVWALCVLAMIFVVTVGVRNRRQNSASAATALPIVNEKPPTFSLVDQDGKTVTSDDLRGKVWVAAFVFTHCEGPCPMMFAKLQKLNISLTDPRIRVVTFTVDPDRDTPAAMKEKLRTVGADQSRWSFLTGDKDAIFGVSKQMMLWAKPAEGDAPIQHDSKILLFDGQGRCRGAYFSNDEADLERLKKDASDLL